MRDHGSQRLGGGLSERPWVSEARWGGLDERPWVSEARWGAGWETVGL